MSSRGRGSTSTACAASTTRPATSGGSAGPPPADGCAASASRSRSRRCPASRRRRSPSGDEPLVAALAALTFHQRVAVVLVHGYGYRLAEAADVLGCTVSTLRNHLARGLEHARRELEGNSK